MPDTLTILPSSDGRMRGRFPAGDFPGTPVTDVNTYVSGHSLFTHTNGAAPNAPATDYTRTGAWIGYFAQEAGRTFRGGGNFGQIASLNTDWASNWSASPGPPAAADIQYTYISNTSSFYPSGSFASQNFSHFIFMASNFEQNTPDLPADWLARALTLLDRLDGQEASAEKIMYIHWPLPSLSGTVADPLDLTAGEWTTYNAYQRGAYLTWHTDWFELIRAQRPNLNMRAVPVGQCIGDLKDNESYMSTVVWTDLNGDAAPHGTESMYFLAGLVMYIALYREVPDLSSFTVPGSASIISEITDNLQAIADYFFLRLTYYNDNGVRVF